MIQNTEKSKEVLKAEQAVAQAKARLDEAKRKESQKKRESANRHKYMMGGIIHRYFPECYDFDEQELNRILAADIKSDHCQRIIEIVKKESAGNGKNEELIIESEASGDEEYSKCRPEQDHSPRFSRCAHTTRGGMCVLRRPLHGAGCFPSVIIGENLSPSLRYPIIYFAFDEALKSRASPTTKSYWLIHPKGRCCYGC